MKKFLTIILILILISIPITSGVFIIRDVVLANSNIEQPANPDGEDTNKPTVAWADLIGAHIMSRDGDLSDFSGTWKVENEEGKSFTANASGYVFTEKYFYFVQGFYDGVDTFTFYENVTTDNLPPSPIISFENNILIVDCGEEDMYFPFEKTDDGSYLLDGTEMLFVKNLDIKTL